MATISIPKKKKRETGEIDQAKVNDMFDLAIRKGVNYFDTAYPYHQGNSERVIASLLKPYLLINLMQISLYHLFENMIVPKYIINVCKFHYFIHQI